MNRIDKGEKIMMKKAEFHGRKFDVFLRPGADESVVAEIFDWQEYRSAEEIIRRNTLPILDVGAHIGIFSLYAKAINPKAIIYALEPEEENFELLKKNISANGIDNVKIFKYALSGETGIRELIIETDSINHHLSESLESIDARHEKISSLSLKDFMSRNGIPQVGLIKMDIEAGEYEVLGSLSEDDFAKIRNIVLEYHDYAGRSHEEIEVLLRQNGFSVQIFPSGFEKNLGFMLARNKRKISIA